MVVVMDATSLHQAIRMDDLVVVSEDVPAGSAVATTQYGLTTSMVSYCTHFANRVFANSN
jgi:hypothetical protein